MTITLPMMRESFYSAVVCDPGMPKMTRTPWR